MAKKHEEKTKPARDIPAPISSETPSTRRLLVEWRERALRAEAALRLVMAEMRSAGHTLTDEVFTAVTNVINDAEKRGGDVI